MEQKKILLENEVLDTHVPDQVDVESGSRKASRPKTLEEFSREVIANTPQGCRWINELSLLFPMVVIAIITSVWVWVHGLMQEFREDSKTYTLVNAALTWLCEDWAHIILFTFGLTFLVWTIIKCISNAKSTD